MKRIGIVFCLLAIFFTNQALAVAKIPVRVFFKNAVRSRFQISPNGNYLSFVQPFKNRMNVFVQKRGTNEVVQVTSETARDIPGYFWKSNNRIVYIKDFNGDENFHVVIVDRDGKNLKDLTPFAGVATMIVNQLEDNETEMLIGMNKRNPEVFDVYRLNVVTGDMKMVAENPGNILNWVTDHAGKIRTAVTTDGVNNTILYRETEETPFKPILTTNFRETLTPLFFTFDNKYIYAASNLNRDKTSIVKYDIANGREMEVIFEHPNVDVTDLNYSHKRNVLTYIPFTTSRIEYKFLDAETEVLFGKLRKHLPKDEISITSSNKNEDLFTIWAYSDRNRGTCYLYEAADDKLTKLAASYPWLKESEMCELKPITYQSRDGLTINGYLTLPLGAKVKNLPVVINPHGGPWARDTWGFDPEVQFLANRGYAVLLLNFRGSTGYGKKFWEASFKQWGKKMQDDVSDGVNWLIKQGIADPKRVAIYGASYGGYCALAGLAFTPELYACGVDYVGISNLFTFLKSFPPLWKPLLDTWYEQIGNPEKDKELMESASPALHVDKIRVPLFVAQGAKDPRVNINESNQIVEALKKRGINVEYMVKENEGHGFRNEENRFDFYEAMEKFLEKNLLVKK